MLSFALACKMSQMTALTHWHLTSLWRIQGELQLGRIVQEDQRVSVTYQNCQIMHKYQSENPLHLLLSDPLQREISL